MHEEVIKRFREKFDDDDYEKEIKEFLLTELKAQEDRVRVKLPEKKYRKDISYTKGFNQALEEVKRLNGMEG